MKEMRTKMKFPHVTYMLTVETAQELSRIYVEPPIAYVHAMMMTVYLLIEALLTNSSFHINNGQTLFSAR